MMVDKGQGRIALSASSQTIGNLIVALMAVGILRITTHQLGPSDYGLFALVVTYVSLVSLIADLGITAMTTRELSRAGADRSTLFGTAFSSRVALSVLAIPVIIGSAAFLYPDKGSQFHAAIEVMSLDVLFTTVQVTAGTAFSAMVRGHVLAIVTVANRVLYLVGVVFVAVAHGSYLGYICAYVGADFLIAVLLFTMARIEMPLVVRRSGLVPDTLDSTSPGIDPTDRERVRLDRQHPSIAPALQCRTGLLQCRVQRH
jgi:O-antigen/teichoic acid export membrane protein